MASALLRDGQVVFLLCSRLLFKGQTIEAFFPCGAGQWLTYTLQPKLQPFMMATSLAHGYLRYTVNQTTLAAQVRHLAHLLTCAPCSSGHVQCSHMSHYGNKSAGGGAEA